MTVNGHTVKSDVPENAVFIDTVYDDTEVKESIEELNSNLSQLELSDIAGGKNLLDLPNPYSITGTYAKSITVKVKKNTNYTLSVGSVTSSVYQGIVVRPINSDTTIISKYSAPYIMSFNSGDNESIRLLFYSGNATSGTSVYSDVQLEEGTEATEYKPYIPSVKMLAEEVSAQNESLSNKTKLSLELGDISWAEGNNLNSTTWKRSGFVKVTPNTKYTLNRTQTEGMNIIGYKEDKSVISDGIINQTSSIVQHCNTAEYEFTTTPTTNYIRIAIVDTNLSENITLTNNGIGNTVVELVEDVDSLKNDLSAHTHKYAGSSSVGGSANSAVKLDSSAGSSTQPVYFSSGKPVACSYTLGKSVPSNAVFTDTNTWIALKGATTSAAGTAGYAPAPSAGAANRYLRSDGTWSVPPDNNTTYSAATQSAQGLMSAADKKKLDGIASGANAYSLPTASSSTLGGIKVGSNLSISNGVLSATNTWRGIQNNLTSTSTTDSLSAAQGKALNDKITTLNSNLIKYTQLTTSVNGWIKLNDKVSIVYSIQIIGMHNKIKWYKYTQFRKCST